MEKMTIDKALQCPVDYAFQRVGGKYKGRVLWHLYSGTKRYGELRRLLPDVSPKMLTQVLRELEGDVLIRRHVYYEVPPRVEYSLEASGREMMPSILQLSKWASDQMDKHGIGAMISDKLLPDHAQEDNKSSKSEM